MNRVIVIGPCKNMRELGRNIQEEIEDEELISLSRSSSFTKIPHQFDEDQRTLERHTAVVVIKDDD